MGEALERSSGGISGTRVQWDVITVQNGKTPFRVKSLVYRQSQVFLVWLIECIPMTSEIRPLPMFKFPSSLLCCHSAVHTMTPSTHLATAGTNHLFPISQYAGVPIHRTTISIHYFKLNIVDRPEKASLACLFLVPDLSIHRQIHGEIQGQLHAEFVMVRYRLFQLQLPLKWKMHSLTSDWQPTRHLFYKTIEQLN